LKNETRKNKGERRGIKKTRGRGVGGKVEIQTIERMYLSFVVCNIIGFVLKHISVLPTTGRCSRFLRGRVTHIPLKRENVCTEPIAC